jgi:hypothetical protein
VRPRERSAILEPVGRSGPAPELTECRGPAFETAAAKWPSPEQGLSDRPVRRARVCTRM